jgi:tRNA G18 (ribose-2'-O)-methylase SpoU
VIHRIDRLDDPRIDAYAHVGDPAWLRDRGLFVAEGRLVVERLIAGARFEPVSFLVTPAALAALQDRLSVVEADVFVTDQTVLNGITGFNFHRGCVALAKRNTDPPLTTFDGFRRMIALEGVGNPDNVGGIFRSAAALGAEGILLDPSTGDPFYRKAIRTSMGAILRVPFARLHSWPEQLIERRRNRLALIGLTPRGPVTVDELAPHTGEGFILVAGAEGTGLSAAALKACDTLVRIPIAPQSDSLNVVVAVSIALQRLAQWW